jgi:hypothetical protein
MVCRNRRVPPRGGDFEGARQRRAPSLSAQARVPIPARVPSIRYKRRVQADLSRPNGGLDFGRAPLSPAAIYSVLPPKALRAAMDGRQRWCDVAGLVRSRGTVAGVVVAALTAYPAALVAAFDRDAAANGRAPDHAMPGVALARAVLGDGAGLRADGLYAVRAGNGRTSSGRRCSTGRPTRPEMVAIAGTSATSCATRPTVAICTRPERSRPVRR